MILIQQDTLYQ